MRLRPASAFVILALLIALGCGLCEAIFIDVTGDWSETINSADLVAGAGSDLIGTYESGAFLVDISDTAGAGDAWQVDIHKVDGTWHGDFVLFAQRTSDGTGGSVSGGAAYQQITGSSTAFFDGSDNVTGINVQLKLEGVSIAVPPAAYSTMVYYTVVDT